MILEQFARTANVIILHHRRNTFFVRGSAEALQRRERCVTAEKKLKLPEARKRQLEKQEEGEAQEKMFEKFVCYCQTNSEKLQKSVDDLTESIPQHEASVKSKVEMKAQIEEELKGPTRWRFC